MKTKTQLSALTLIISMMFATNTFALKKNIEFEEETYIDDIPFNTEWVVSEMMITSLDFEEEAYIDDIPFNTASVAAIYNYNKAVTVVFEMDEETNIDDIPFDTKQIAVEYDYNTAVSVEFVMDTESSIDDIPFDTHSIAAQTNRESNIKLYAAGK